MNKVEVAEILTSLTVPYPSFSKDQDKEALINLWYATLGAFPKALVNMAIMEHISTSKFPPSVFEIKEIIYKQNTLHGYTFDEIWNLILKAVDSGEYYLGDISYSKSYARLPKEVKDIITIDGLHQIAVNSISENEYIKNQLRRRYQEIKDEKLHSFLTSSQPLTLIPHWETKLQMNSKIHLALQNKGERK